VLLGLGGAVIVGQAVFDGPSWAKHAPFLGRAAFLIVVAAAAIWLSYRGWRSGVRFDERGVTIQKTFRTQRFGWAEVSHFADGCFLIHGVTPQWVPRIVLRDGKFVSLDQWAWGRKIPDRDMLPTIASRYGIGAELTFVPLAAEKKEKPSPSA
jgi:hypothetical protein